MARTRVFTEKGHKALLAKRQVAMRAFEADPTPENETAKNAARAAVRMSRKARKAA